MATWYTVEEAQAAWPGLGAPDVEQLQQLLDVSKAECVAYSPVTDENDIPDGHRWAHLAHARNIWNAQKVNPAGGIGGLDGSTFALQAFPMDWNVRARLRPRTVFGGPIG